MVNKAKTDKPKRIWRFIVLITECNYDFVLKEQKSSKNLSKNRHTDI